MLAFDQNVPAPSITADEFSFNLLSYLGKVAISEQSLEVSGDLWVSEEHIPSELASTVSHKSFQLINQKPEGKFFSIVPMGEEAPQACFAEEGEESPPKNECFCQANLRAYAEHVETEESSTESDEDESKLEEVVSIASSITDKQKFKVGFIQAAVPMKQEAKDADFCYEFDSIDAIADKFVGWLLKSAVAAVSFNGKRRDESEAELKEAVCSIMTFVESCSFSWPMIKDFTEQVGIVTVREYIATWYYTENWMFDVNLVLRQSDESSDYFTYETIWGIPSKQYPVPQVTASIFFVFEVSRIKPVNCLVDITYYYEGCSYAQAPLINFFNEKQLSDIVDAKLKFYKQLRF